MKRFVAAIALAASPAAAAAHDFWLQPVHFSLAPGAATALTIEVGHGPYRSRWSGAVDRVALMRSYGPEGAVDLKGALRPSPEKDGELAFRTAGTHVLAFQSTPALSDLPSIRFNDYLKVEGLTPAIDLRNRTGSNDRPGREVYSRRAKAILEVGPPGAGPEPWVTRPVGLSLEIVPEKNPYRLAPGEALPVRILYDGRPLPGALVKLTNLEFDVRPVAMRRSDAEGRASFEVPRTGTWLLNVIWTRPLDRDPRADFDTTFSSLTFGYGRGLGLP